MQKIRESFVKESSFLINLLFIVLTASFVFLFLNGLDADDYSSQIWSATYQIVAWIGALCGLYFTNLWGGWRSLIGRANSAFALGLLAQSFGQIIFSFYFYKGIEVPYPSIADLGFFGSIPFYIYGITLLAQVSGTQFSLKLMVSKIQASIIAIVILIFSYAALLRDYEFDWGQPLIVLLDFGYPFGQAVFIALAIVTYLLSRNFLGGLMRKPIIFFIIALVAQYIADYTFLFKVSRDTYHGELWVDYLYLIAYFVMALSLTKLASVFYKIKNS